MVPEIFLSIVHIFIKIINILNKTNSRKNNNYKMAKKKENYIEKMDDILYSFKRLQFNLMTPLFKIKMFNSKT
jgi:hypothetical protein